MSTIAKTISALENYNKWRRGDDTLPMPDPFETGVAIGDAVRLLRELETEKTTRNHLLEKGAKLETELARLRAEVERLNEQLRIESASSAHALHWAEKAEAELITEQTRLDYLGLHMGTRMVAEALNCDYSKCFPIRDAIDLAMKNESNTP